MLRTLTLFAAFVLSAAPGFSAPLSLTLTPAVETGQSGDFVTFEGTLVNLGPPDLFLNDIAITFTTPAETYLVEDPNVFFFNVPGVLLEGGGSYTGPIIGFTIAPNTPAGTYLGSIVILGGDDEFALDPLNSDEAGSFSVVVVPEPRTASLLLAGLAAVVAARRRSL